MLEGVVIREFRMPDTEEILRLWKETGLSLRAADSFEQLQVKMQRDPELSLVAESQGQLVGSLLGAWDGRRGWLYHFAVAPSLRHSGLGKRLLEEVEARMGQKGVLEVYGLVHAANADALGVAMHCNYRMLPELVVVAKPLGPSN